MIMTLHIILEGGQMAVCKYVRINNKLSKYKTKKIFNNPIIYKNTHIHTPKHYTLQH